MQSSFCPAAKHLGYVYRTEETSAVPQLLNFREPQTPTGQPAAAPHGSACSAPPISSHSKEAMLEGSFTVPSRGLQNPTASG